MRSCPYFYKIIGIFLFSASLGTALTATAQTNCAVNSRVLAITDDLHFSDGDNLRMKKEVSSLYDRFYCKDKRTFFNHLAEKFLRLEQSLDQQSKQNLEQYRKEFGLPAGKDPKQMFSSDKETIKNFDRLYQAYRRELFPKGNDDSLRDLEIVLVGGFASDWSRPFTFKDIHKVLKRDFQLKDDNIHFVFPDSSSSQEEGIKKFEDAIALIQKKHPQRKILVVGYSWGGAVALEGVIKNPGLLDSLYAFVTVNAPLKGTLTARAARKALAAISNLTNFGRTTNSCDCSQDDTGISASLRALEPNENITNKLQNLSDDDYAKLSKILFFVTTSVFPIQEPTKVGTYVLKEENDGTVPKSSQYLRTIGRRIADLNAGHTDFMMSGAKSSLNEYDRQAFAKALFQTLTNPDLFYYP